MAKTNTIDIVLQSKSFSGSSHRTYLNESLLNQSDYLTIGFLIVSLLLVIVLYIWYGVGKFSWLINNI